MPTSALLHASCVSLGYNAHHLIVQDFNATIAAGQFIGIFGPNGAGKTTLLQSLLGTIPVLDGTLTLLGKTPKKGNPLVGYMPQHLPRIHPRISTGALLGATISGHRWGLPWLSAASKANLDLIVCTLDAQHLMNKPFMSLSGGEERRIWLAQALLGQPKILLLDEPLAHLDMHYQHLLVRLLSRIQKQWGITILLTAHDINPLLPVMTQVLYLASGKAAMGSTKAVINSDTLSRLYGTPIEVVRCQDRIFVIHSHTGKIENVACH